MWGGGGGLALMFKLEQVFTWTIWRRVNARRPEDDTRAASWDHFMPALTRSPALHSVFLSILLTVQPHIGTLATYCIKKNRDFTSKYD